ncbi:phosphotransferase family protein [Kaistia granuli]|uniref:phosphotransferase family protein n=1 Tax=Kaistia granuli TaxID=363259 RepID=UPI00037D2F07|nr:phosphotransferase [Kaistia granuli]
METIDRELAAWLVRAGLVEDGAAMVAEPLTGGVASDIWRVEAGGRRFAVKRALAKLRVARDWRAPVSRNGNEVEWLLEAGRVVPDAVPRILAHDAAVGAFAMDYLQPEDHPVWKAELRAGRADPAFAAAVGRAIAAIHSATAGSDAIRARFDTDEIFHSIRLEPYLEATAEAHPDLAPQLMAISRDTLARKIALVHGDVSPKNILVGPKGPVFLDAECAWYGDPAFDLAFCLNQLLLKCLWVPANRAAYLASFDALASAYLDAVDWEPRADVEARVARILPGLFLGRVDGKSPAEYITTDEDRNRVRRVARSLIATPPAALATIRDAWEEELSK